MTAVCAARARRTPIRSYQLFVGGVWGEAEGGGRLPVVDPSTGERFATLAAGTAADVGRAVTAARAALDGAWGKVGPADRGRLLARIGRALEEHEDELVALEARDTGKPLATARTDVKVMARYFEFYGGAADKVCGQVIPLGGDYQVTVEREPLGVTGHILPWNYPAQMVGRTIAPALAMGNAAVLKPSEEGCLSALRAAEVMQACGLPDGAFNVVTGLGEIAGAALCGHPHVDLVSFTGSPEVGTLVQQAAARHHHKVVLELGGKSPQIVFADADLDRAATVVCKGILQNAGQTCSAGSRLLVERRAWDEVISRVVARLSAARVGSAAMDLDCGPLINRAQLQRVQRYIDQAIADGLPVLARGQLAPGLPAGGHYLAPVMFGPVPRDHALATREVFGPVLAALPFDDEADAVALANGTEYGLIAGLWTRDGDRQQRVARRLRCGQVYINCYGAAGGVELPFGGVKKSGHGREKGLAALEEMSVTKTVVHLHG